MSTSSVYPETSRAVTALTLAIVGLGVPLPVGFGAWVSANRELAAIESGRRNPASAGVARLARVIGIVGTAMFTTALTLFLLALTGVIEVR